MTDVADPLHERARRRHWCVRCACYIRQGKVEPVVGGFAAVMWHHGERQERTLRTSEVEDSRRFEWFAPLETVQPSPHAQALLERAAAVHELQVGGLIDSKERITPLGLKLLALQAQSKERAA